jgi:hypothetical protein
MKSGVVPAIAVAAVLLGSLVWWKVQPTQAPTADSPLPSVSAPSGSEVDLSAVEAVSAETTGSKGARAAVASIELQGERTAPNDAGPIASAASIHQGRGDVAIVQAPSEPKSDDEAENRVFEQKYAWMNSKDRRDALESLRKLLDGSAGSGLGKEPPPTAERSLEIKREIEWLATHIDR